MSTHLRVIFAATLAVVGLASACSSSAKTSPPKTGGSAASAAADTVRISTDAGRLVGPNGHTLYANTVDTASKISCTAACAQEWPPLIGTPTVSGSDVNLARFATAPRPDGSKQVTFDGHPLYSFDGDKAAGDKKGEGIADEGGSWHAAQIAIVSTTGGVSPSPSDSSGSGY